MAQGMQPPPPPGGISPTAGDGNLAKAMEAAVSKFRQGNLGEAEAGLEEVLRSDPNSAGATHFLGLIAHRQGRHDRGVELLVRAIEMNHVVPYFHGNLAEVYRSLGRHDEAIASSQRALELYAVYPEALNTLGAAQVEQQDYAEAEKSLRRAIEFKPNFAVAHANLGNVMREMGRLEKAAGCYERAIRHDPKLAGALMALGNCQRALGLLHEAAASFRKTVELVPDDAKAMSSLGTALSQLQRDEEALDCLRKAVSLEPGLGEAHANLGTALVGAGRSDEALDSYATALTLRRGPASDAAGGATAPVEKHQAGFRFATLAKLRHDIAQYRQLIALGRLPASFEGDIAGFEETLGELEAAGGAEGRIALTPEQQRKIGASYNRLLHLAAAPAMAEGPLNPDFDTAAIESAYHGDGASIAQFDDLLSEDALAALHRYCLESTIWFDFGAGEDCLYSHLNDGLSCGLLLQIAEQLRDRLPAILGEHHLVRAVASSGGPKFSGGELRSDAAAVNVTFWITPDTAQLDNDSGGLLVYGGEMPMGIANGEATKGDAVAEGDSIKVTPRQNRAVIFDAKRAYKMAAASVKEGHENRRIAITMLFGNPAQEARQEA